MLLPNRPPYQENTKSKEAEHYAQPLFMFSFILVNFALGDFALVDAERVEMRLCE